MSLTGTEWQDLAVLSRYDQILKLKKDLTEEETCVSIWLTKHIKILTEKK